MIILRCFIKQFPRISPPFRLGSPEICMLKFIASLLLYASFALAADAPKAELVKADSTDAKPVPESEFTPLFNGKDMTGWTGGTEGYEVKDGGILSYTTGKGGHLLTEKEYADFIFRFEFKLDPGTNNGVAIRAPLKGDPAYVGMEFQILDDGHPKYKGIKEYQSHGSVYGIAPAKRGALKPAGEWNEQEIICDGRHVKITLNGVVINDVNLDEVAPDGKTIDGQKHPGMNNKTGHLGFAGHGDHIEFRNLRIKELNTEKK